MPKYAEISRQLMDHPRTWLVTGVAGFIGSNILERLLALDQVVVGLDNFSTGRPENLENVRQTAKPGAWKKFTFHEGDTRDLAMCRRACEGVELVLHQAALGSVPRSIKEPITSHESNVNGFLNMLVAARDAGVSRMVYASSSSVYGDDPQLPKVEERVGNPLSPYAVTKAINEAYAAVFGRSYGFKAVGLRYFNVFGPRQDPDGPYAAVMPKWIDALVKGQPCQIHGDGETSRDFCFVANAVQANILAATAPAEGLEDVFNVSFGGTTSLTQLYWMIAERLAAILPGLKPGDPVYAPFRPGDIRHSQADLTRIKTQLGYDPTHSVAQGLDELVPWFAAAHARS
ncbi:capsular polysaccharide biosynthesis protein [Mesoterricola silvestris]|uniref:Capsular polysaccharide biosynthesis protein n=2 Tax=Mesoterricola silvestris TaxID=2927979 RepID=A0AA48GFL4_9BACT|nr:SDR family oxidoreductase [Mesoterricola silvestris]BDU71771.1 capsular polysaccharide biosynthesis protein [Mesoterricola silvestris]